jgi:predicted amidohydrolase
MKVYAVQFDMPWENKPASHAKVRELLGRAQPEPGSLVVLPEMFDTGFSMNVTATTDAVTQASQTFAAEMARAYGVYLMAGIVLDGQNGKGRNEALTYTPQGELLARYCKLQPFTLGGEKDNYEAGHQPVIFSWQGFNVAPFICYDLRFPELFRVASKRGANLIVVIASWPARRVNHWEALLKARAIENQAYVVGLNRTGHDPILSYSGRTQIIAPNGDVLAEAQDEEVVVSSSLSLDFLNDYRAQLPFLADIRADFLPGV